MIAALVVAAGIGGAVIQHGPTGNPDSVPRITLAEAITAATRLDPDYVLALGQVDNAEWSRRAALAFGVPRTKLFAASSVMGILAL